MVAAGVRNPAAIKAVGPFATANAGVKNPTKLATVAGARAHVRNPTIFESGGPPGEYAVPPDHRMLWDLDGTRMRKYAMPSWSEYTYVEIQALNDEDGTTVISDTLATAASYVVFFPERRDLAAVFVSFALTDPAHEVTVDVQTSPDTLNGADGTWTSHGGPEAVTGGSWGANPADYRAPVPVTASGVRAVRLVMDAADPSYGWTLRSLHLYGHPSPGANPHRLELWHPTLDQRVGPAYFDWKRSPRGSSADRKFRVKNLSPTQRANTVYVSCDALTDTYPSVAYQHFFSTGGTFANTLTLSVIDPNQVSPVITLRRVTPSDAPLGAWAPRITAVVGGWY